MDVMENSGSSKKRVREEDTQPGEGVEPKFVCHQSSKQNPMEIAGVLHCLFGFLSLRELKVCRSVCIEWKCVAKPFIRNLSLLSIGSVWNETSEKSAMNFIKTFQQSEPEIPFHALELKNYVCDGREVPWPEDNLIEIFEALGKNITELRIDDLRIGMFETFGSRYDMSHLLEKLNLKKLTINFPKGEDLWEGRNGPMLKISMDKIIGVKYLYLRECALKFKKNTQISPVEMDLKKCLYVFPKGNIGRVINKYINFENMKNCTIWTDNNSFMSEIALDLSGNMKVDSMDLSGINILDWETSQWKINTLVLEKCGRKYISSTSMDVKQLKSKFHSINLDDVPNTIEKLSVRKLNFQQGRYYRLPNLKYINTLRSLSDRFPIPSNVTSLEFGDHFQGILKMSTKQIPAQITKLRVNTRALIVNDEKTQELEKLVLNGFSLYYCKDVLPKLPARNLVFNLYRYDVVAQSIQYIVASGFLDGPYESIAVGPIWWQAVAENFQDTEFAELVNEKSEYYLFKGRVGTAIDKNQFEKILEL